MKLSDDLKSGNYEIDKSSRNVYKVLGLLKHTRILIKDGSDELLGVQNAELLFFHSNVGTF